MTTRSSVPVSRPCWKGPTSRSSPRRASGKDAVKLAEQLKPDVILLDIRMPDMDGLAALEKIRAKVPATKVVMLSTYDNPTYIARAVALGASDFVLKGSTREALIETIMAAAAGESPRAPANCAASPAR